MRDEGNMVHDPADGNSTILEKAGKALRVLKEIMIGLTVQEIAVDLRKEKGQLNNLFMLIVFGDLVGMPILPPYYSLRLLPHVVPHIQRWKRSLLRERDWTDLGTFDL